jgi:hypothetical protein
MRALDSSFEVGVEAETGGRVGLCCLFVNNDSMFTRESECNCRQYLLLFRQASIPSGRTHGHDRPQALVFTRPQNIETGICNAKMAADIDPD